MPIIEEMIRHKYKTNSGMLEIHGIIAVSDMIRDMGRMGQKIFFQLKRARDKLVMSKIRYLPLIDVGTLRQRYINMGFIVPKNS